MNHYECPREQDLLDALAASRWPDRCDDDLRAHVAECRICSDTLLVALPLVTEAEIAHATAHVPSSGIVWWRAQMRARQEAAAAAEQPFTIAQGIAFAVTVALVAGVAMWIVPGVRSWFGWARAIAEHATIEWPSLAGIQALAPTGPLGWCALGLWLVLAPVALYFVVTSD